MSNDGRLYPEIDVEVDYNPDFDEPIFKLWFGENFVIKFYSMEDIREFHNEFSGKIKHAQKELNHLIQTQHNDVESWYPPRIHTNDFDVKNALIDEDTDLTEDIEFLREDNETAKLTEDLCDYDKIVNDAIAGLASLGYKKKWSKKMVTEAMNAPIIKTPENVLRYVLNPATAEIVQ